MHHCVRLEILLGNESEFSRNGVRMREIWPSEVQRISESKTTRNSNSKFEFKPRSGLDGKFPAQDPGRLGSRPTRTQGDWGVDRAVDPPDQVNWAVDLGVDLVPEPGFEPECILMYLVRFLSRFVALTLFKQPQT